MSNKFLNIIIAIVVVFSAIAFPIIAKITNITYPILELDNCGSQEACADFCDKETNRTTCVSWAESEGLITNQEAVRMKDIDRMRQQAEGENVDPIYGPGNCQTPSECDAYCRQDKNLDECMRFSVDNGYITSEEADEIIAKRDRGGPGGCSSEEECRDFCGNPDNIEECMYFVVEEGRITREEADFMIKEARKHQRPIDDYSFDDGPDDDFVTEDVQLNEDRVRQILETTEGPGGCKTIEECDAYCEQDDHGEECFTFAKEHQLISQEKAERMEKMMNMIGPGGCDGRTECDIYCSQEENMDECFNFSKENGLMSPEELNRMEKGIEIKRRLDSDGGPGGCQTPSECDAYCKQEENKSECMDFSVDSGMITQEERQRMEIIEEKMRLIEEKGMEGRIQEREIRHDDTISPDNNFISPEQNIEYDNMFPPSDDGMYPDGETYYDNAQPDGGNEIYNDTIINIEEGYQPDGSYQMSPEVLNEGDVIDGNMTPSDDGLVPSEGDVHYDDLMPSENETFNEEPVSRAGGLFYPLIDQIRNFLANTGFFFR